MVTFQNTHINIKNIESSIYKVEQELYIFNLHWKFYKTIKKILNVEKEAQYHMSTAIRPFSRPLILTNRWRDGAYNTI